MQAPNNINILMVDDDEVDILNTKSEFEKLFQSDVTFHFDIARNGVEALDKLYGRNNEKKISPEAILLDLNMPKMDGIEFLKQLRTDHTFDNLPVYLLTGLYRSDNKIAIQHLKVKKEIIKPIQHDDALRIYMELLGLS